MERHIMVIKLATTKETREIEEAADKAGISYKEMMERAGQAAANRAMAILEGIDSPFVTILVGPGNNGGDGLVTGLLIKQANENAEVRFYLLKERADDDPYITVAKEADIFIALSENDKDKRLLRNMVAQSDMVIDALFGIGITLPLRDEAAQMLRAVKRGLTESTSQADDQWAINPISTASVKTQKPFVLAIDGPSGLDFDTGELDSAALFADETVTFIAAKPGLIRFPGADAIGKLTVANLGITDKIKPLKSVKNTILDMQTVKEHMPDRPLNSSKRSFGRAMVVAGSINFVGAVHFSASAAYRAGAGLVSIATARPVTGLLASTTPEATWLLLPHDMGVISKEAAPIVLEEMGDRFSGMLIGPGLSQEETTRQFVYELLGQGASKADSKKRHLGFMAANEEDDDADDKTTNLPPLIIDADGLNALSKEEKWWERLPENTILTPHIGEMSRLTGLEIDEIEADRLEVVSEHAKKWKAIVLLKGAHTLIADVDGTVTVLPFKNDALATAGTGDVLSGIIVGLLAQGVKPYDAACVGGYIHGLAGEYAAQDIHPRSVIASDVVNHISAALKAITG